MYTLRQEFVTGVQQQQRLLLSFSMQQAILVLQMPTLELEEWLKGEIEENPCLEYEGSHPSSSSYSGKGNEDASYERDYADPPSLFTHLMEQARLFFTNSEELEIAEFLIGSLDDRGFLSEKDLLPSMEKTLKALQFFDPPGIAARSLQESLLIQLRLQKKQELLAYQIIEHHFEDLLHNRHPQISKRLKCSTSQIEEAIKLDISRLNLRPAARFFHEPTLAIIPDLLLKKEEETWSIEINEDLLPEFSIKMAKKKDSAYLQRAKWVKRAIENRKKTLLQICRYLVKKQDLFLSGESDSLEPMTMQEIADALSLHISTIGRAVAQKYLFCPRGLLAMRGLFCYDLGNAMSNQSAKQLLLDVIDKENKERPLSDEALSLKMSARGVPLARRTVTKYRKLHNIPSASQRRRWTTSTSV